MASREPPRDRPRQPPAHAGAAVCAAAAVPGADRRFRLAVRALPDARQLHQHRHPGGAHRDHRHRHDLRAAGRRHRPLGRRQHVRLLHRRGALSEGLEPGLRLPGRRDAGPPVRRRERFRHHPPARAGIHRHAGHAVYRPCHRALFLGREDGPVRQGDPAASAAPACSASPPRSGSSSSSSCWPG